MNNVKIIQPRRKYLVSWALQGKLLLGIVAASFLSFSLILVDFYLSFGRNAGWDPAMLEIFLKAQKLPVIQLVVFAFAMVFLTIYFSHQWAGPLINVEKSLDRLGAGDLTTRIQLRPRDQLKNIRDAFNHAAVSLQTRALADREAVEKIRTFLDRLDSEKILDDRWRGELRTARERAAIIAKDWLV